MFIFIKNQLMNKDHPLNKIAANFVFHYVEYYSKEILNNAEQFNVTKENDFTVSHDQAPTHVPLKEQKTCVDIIVRDMSMNSKTGHPPNQE